MAPCGFNGVRIKPDGIHDLSSHQFQEDLHLKNVTVQILRCKVCGKISVGWHRQSNTEEISPDTEMEE